MCTTVFYKICKKYEVTVLKKGYHHLYTVKYEGRNDTVWRWEYGDYEGVKILDIIMFHHYHISINVTPYDIGYSVYAYKAEGWRPLMGGTLFYFNDQYFLIESAKAKRNKLLIKCNGKDFIYKIDFNKKTIKKEGG